MTDHLTWKLVDETAAALGASDAARLKWRQAGRGVPAEWRAKIADALRETGIDVRFDDFGTLPANPGRIAA